MRKTGVVVKFRRSQQTDNIVEVRRRNARIDWTSRIGTNIYDCDSKLLPVSFDLTFKDVSPDPQCIAPRTQQTPAMPHPASQLSLRVRGQSHFAPLRLKVASSASYAAVVVNAWAAELYALVILLRKVAILASSCMLLACRSAMARWSCSIVARREEMLAVSCFLFARMKKMVAS